MYLLDTCAFLYFLSDSPKLSEKARTVIESDMPVFLSQATLWEIAIKKTIGKLDISETTFDLEKICIEGGIEIIPIKKKYFETIQQLPYIHGDPFDRLIMASAIEEGLLLITDDSQIRKYQQVNIFW